MQKECMLGYSAEFEVPPIDPIEYQVFDGEHVTKDNESTVALSQSLHNRRRMLAVLLRVGNRGSTGA